MGLSISDNIYSLQLPCYHEGHRRVNKYVLGTTTRSVLCYILWRTDVLDIKGLQGAYSLSSPSELIPQEAPYSSSPTKPTEEELPHTLRSIADRLLPSSCPPILGEKEGWSCVAWNLLGSLSAPLPERPSPLLHSSMQDSALPLGQGGQGGLQLSYY